MSESLLQTVVRRYGADALAGMLSPEQLNALRYEWQAWARPEQLAPIGAWLVWLLMAGRGFGKSRTGAEWVRSKAESMPGTHGALVAPTAADARDVMVKALLGCSMPGEVEYEPSKRSLTWANGTTATLYTAEEPDRLRGPQHAWAWCFVAGTMVLMADGGERPIECIAVGDLVQTRTGARVVTAAGLTKRAAPIWRLSMSNGRSLDGTGDHKIFANDAFVPLREVAPGSMLTTWQAQSCSMGSSIGLTERTTSGAQAVGSFIVSCGKRLMARYQRAISFITSTKTSSTTAWRISFSCPSVSTSGPMALADAPPWARLSGLQRPGPNGNESRRSLERASGAGSSTDLAQPIAPGAERSAESPLAITALKSESTGRLADVYDITVDGEHEFFANGALVHNCDELAAWAYPEDTWDMLQMTMRLGDTPQVCVSTTPRPIPIVRRLMADGGTVITRGSTYDNAANLSPAFLAAVKERYEGTRLGRQELYAEILDDVPGALWTRGMLESARVKTHPVGLRRIVVAVDPSGGHDAENDEQGIIVAGLGQDGLAYVLEDATCKLSPEGWGRRVVDAYVRHEADRVLWERNFGGEMVEHVITTAAKAQGVTVSTREVKASRGKVVRAEPIAALYEQCVAAGSLISTALGELRIEDIAAGDMVWTRAGLRRVLWAGQTGIKPTLIIRPSVGAALVCTGDHPVYIDGRGYISARDIVPKCDKLIQWEPGQGVLIAASRSASPAGVVSRVRRLVGGLRTGSHFGRSSNSTVDAITLTARAIGALAGTPGIVCFIGTSGRWPTDQYQTGGTCTTLTATQGTTRFQTSKRCHRATTSRSHMVAEGLAPVRRGSRSASGQRPGGRRAGRQLTSANSASASSPRELLAYASVPPPAIRVSGIVSVENGPVLPVYNLTVEGEPEFFANGVLVHNCKVRHLGSFPQLEDQLCLFTPSGEFSKSPDRADALVWALTDLMLGEGAAVFVRHNPSPRRV